MKQLILIIPSTSIKNFNYNAAKKNIMSYIGTRLVEECPEEMPGMLVKEVLDKEDKQAITGIVFPNHESGTIAFITFNEDNEPNDSYLSAEVL